MLEHLGAKHMLFPRCLQHFGTKISYFQGIAPYFKARISHVRAQISQSAAF